MKEDNSMNRIHSTTKSFVFVSDISIHVLNTLDGSSHSLQHEFREIENVKLPEKIIDYSAFSPTHDYFVCVYSDKVITLWKTGESAWVKIGDIVAVRRSMCVCFTPTEDKLLVADKSGDLYDYSISEIGSKEIDEDKDKEPILGHVSMLLDVISTDRYVITADRDEKIRVSLIDAPHVVQSFCLSHTEFVTKIVAVKSTSTLVSLSGDGTMRAWNMDTGELQQTVSLLEPSEKSKPSKLVPDIVSSTTLQNLFAVSCSGSNKIHIFRFEANKEQPLHLSYDIFLPCGTEIFDASFVPSEGSDDFCNLFILSNVNGAPCCTITKCRDNSFTFCDSKPITDFIASFASYSLQKRDFSPYFRLKIESNVYEAFKRKKQQHKLKAKQSKLSVAN